MITILSHNSSASSIECVVNTIELSFFYIDISFITLHINLLAYGSIPEDGSSKNIIGGLPNNAIATDNFLLLPPEYVPACIFLYYYKFIFYIISSTKYLLY